MRLVGPPVPLGGERRRVARVPPREELQRALEGPPEQVVRHPARAEGQVAAVALGGVRDGRDGEAGRQGEGGCGGGGGGESGVPEEGVGGEGDVVAAEVRREGGECGCCHLVCEAMAGFAWLAGWLAG